MRALRWLNQHTPTLTATGLARFQLSALLVWLAPGAFVSWLLRDILAWTNFMSWYAICIGHFAAWQGARAERAAKAST